MLWYDAMTKVGPEQPSTQTTSAEALFVAINGQQAILGLNAYKQVKDLLVLLTLVHEFSFNLFYLTIVLVASLLLLEHSCLSLLLHLVKFLL